MDLLLSMYSSAADDDDGAVNIDGSANIGNNMNSSSPLYDVMF